MLSPKEHFQYEYLRIKTVGSYNTVSIQISKNSTIKSYKIFWIQMCENSVTKADYLFWSLFDSKLKENWKPEGLVSKTFGEPSLSKHFTIKFLRIVIVKSDKKFQSLCLTNVTVDFDKIFIINIFEYCNGRIWQNLLNWIL